MVIIGYLVAVLLGAALLTPPLHHLGQWFLSVSSEHGWRDSSMIGWIVIAAEKTKLPGYFSRAALIVALAGLWPLFRMLRMSRKEITGTEIAADEFRNGLSGFIMAAGVLGLLFVLFSMLNVCRVSSNANWWKIGLPLISGLSVACIEEFLFRGAMLGVLRRSFRPRVAMLVTTGLFAVLHFLKPPARGAMAAETVNWTSGFQVLIRLFDGFGNWQNLLAEFLLLFAVGWILAGARVATGGLGLSIGLHAGLVAAMKYFSQVTTPSAAFRRDEFFPWVTENHCKAIVGSYVGLAPVAAVMVTGAVALWICKRRPPA